VDSGQVVRIARGHYALPTLEDPRLAAQAVQGVVSHRSAARLWGLAVLSPDPSTQIIVPRHRKRRSTSANLHWIDLAPREVVGGVTAPLRTVLDCARTLPFSEGLAVADSALRLGLVEPAELTFAAEALRGPGARTAALVGAVADGRSGSGLESVLRATLWAERIKGFVPQVVIKDEDFFARVDLADEQHRIVLEADSFEHHGTRSALVRDCRRYDELTIRGWLVLRFAWEHVMFEPAWVLAMVRAALLRRGDITRRTGATRPLGHPVTGRTG
jgi:very-short-patch-repair endonuclease